MSHFEHDHSHDDAELAKKKAARPQIERDTKYWLSLEQYHQDPEFLKLAETEFQSSPLRDSDGEDGWARREFLKLMGASLAMASASCVRRPVQKIVPYTKQPEEVTLGIANNYTSTYFDGNEGLGLLVRTREGRPLKIEGNPGFPLNKGGVSAKAQASILNLYDPERLKSPVRNLLNEKRTNKDSIGVKWEDADKAVTEQLKKGDVAVLTGAIASPSGRAVVSDFCQAFKAQHVVWEPIGHEDIREGQKASYGEDSVPQYRIDKARMIVSIDTDFLGTWLSPVTFSKQFAEGRRNFEKMNKLVIFESNYSLTGANADVRIKIKPSYQLEVVMGLAHEIVIKKGFSSYAVNGSVKVVLEKYAGVAAKLGIEPELFGKIASDLWAHKGESLVLAGGLSTLTQDSQDLQIAVNFLNSVLENDGRTVEGRSGNTGLTDSYSAMFKLMEEMLAGKIKTLIINKTNPGYALPASARFADALKKVEMVVYTGDRNDETGSMAHYVLPDNHSLETWGDSEFSKGLYAISQPTIQPLYDTRSFQLSLMTWAFMGKVGSKRLQTFETYYDFLRSVWKEEIHPKVGKGKNFDEFWEGVLQTGFVGGELTDSAPRTFKVDALNLIKGATSKEGSHLELVLYPTVMLGDGQASNVSWLHELPDPVTRIMWDNYVSISMETAKNLKIKEGSLVSVKVGSVSLDLPVHIQPGLRNDVAAIAVGYGRQLAGKVANNVGKNAYSFVSYSKGLPIFAGQAVELTSLNKNYPLACVQDHHSMEGRQIVIEATLKEYEKNKGANVHRHHTWSIWSGHQYSGHKWGMAVDLNVCTGCSACMVACQSENNIPVVGKKYVLQGREMHWIRVDRYYTGTPDNPEVVFQPVMCQHCDNAPCETVCPVLATVHSNEGLNDMVYNRCVGTRYCSNNCPYKVRRYNWFAYNNNIEKPLHLALNPDVATRVRGVMEKCSFCVHRIKAGKDAVRKQGRKLKDGDIVTACQSACPTNAIVFGDLNDTASAVAKMFKSEPRSYALLEEWNAAPSVRYLTKIRNNDKESMGAESHGRGHGGQEHSQNSHSSKKDEQT